MLYKKIMSREQTRETLDDLLALARRHRDSGEIDIMLEITKFIKKTAIKWKVEWALGLIEECYKMEAEYSFDSYMVYLEWDREPERRFYLPRRRVLMSTADAMQDLIDDRLDLLTISMPPGSGKSTLGIFFLSWVMGKFPNNCNLASAHSGLLTRSFYDGVLEIITDPEYRYSKVFPNSKLFSTNSKEETIDLVKKHRFSSLTCRAIGASLTGATRCEKILYADDLCSGIEEAMSKDRLDKLWDKYTNDLKSRKKLGCKEIHIATRWSVHDVIGRLEDMYGGDERCRFIVMPALDENGESNFNYDYGVGFDTKYFEDMRASLDDVSFRALFMNQPIEREGLLYNEDELRRYYELPGEPDIVLGVADTAEGGGDDTFLPVAYGYGDDWYIEDCVCTDALPEVSRPMCVDVLMRNNVKQCQFESNNAGAAFADAVHDTLKERGSHCNITKKRTTANKETKIIVNSAWVKEHCVFKDSSQYTRNSPYGQMIKKLCSYTIVGKNKHDDVPDGMAQLAEYIQGLAGKKIQVYKRVF